MCPKCYVMSWEKSDEHGYLFARAVREGTSVGCDEGPTTQTLVPRTVQIYTLSLDMGNETRGLSTRLLPTPTVGTTRALLWIYCE